MPLVEISVIEGRTPQTLRALISTVTSAVCSALEVAPSDTRVILREVPATHWASGDVTVAERQSGAADRVST